MNTPIIKYITVRPGETKVIKKSATILSVINDKNVTYTSTCGNLPTPEILKCYDLHWTYINNGNGASEPWDYASGEVITAIYIGGIRYSVTVSGKGIFLREWFDKKDLGIIFNVEDWEDQLGMASTSYRSGITFSTIASAATDMYVEFTTHGSSNARIYPSEIDCPPAP